jgi:hypothetical protein
MGRFGLRWFRAKLNPFGTHRDRPRPEIRYDVASLKNPACPSDEEILYRQARPVLGVYLLLRQDPRVRTFGVRNATVLSSLSAFRAPDDLDARNSRPYRANTGAGSIHPSAVTLKNTVAVGARELFRSRLPNLSALVPCTRSLRHGRGRVERSELQGVLCLEQQFPGCWG